MKDDSPHVDLGSPQVRVATGRRYVACPEQAAPSSRRFLRVGGYLQET